MSRDLARLQESVSAIVELKREVEGLREEASEKEFQLVGEELSKEETKAFLSGKYDTGDAIFTITAGAGGQDAQDWATMLLRMYQRYAERKGFKTSIIHESANQVSMGIEGSFVYGFLKKETGVHRLVRISPFSAKALRHTSFAAVEVLPEIRLGEEKIEIKPEEIVLEVSKSSGPGGQNVNKRETAVRIVHIPTGIAVESQTQRSQQQNKERALEILAAKLYQIREQEKDKELATLRQAQGKPMAIEWGSQIRSYVLHPYQMVKDHRTNVETSDTAGVLDGRLDEFIEAQIRK
ncbi:MAG: hypothetical protein Greene071421_43 [Parcubacteria group bacterium Greene0714_21]|nr:MAG: hypothetical protein Greene041639_441 [Parcubacteria group bacterium Greene0416_39]TSC97926.1 MAG: hypothetical protein Greene101447_224 [Parcubacteria group bacterium Greene1014_47]TSD04557.1 MAG: hypothetical protein Greene071421_43 [Parcubacteria group bacterium Greene0714_21]